MPPGKPPTSHSEVASNRTSFTASRTKKEIFHKVGIYGCGGIGKTELASLVSAWGVKPLFIDLEDSAKYLDVDCVDPPIANWDELRTLLHSESALNDYDAIVIDSLTRAEELSLAWTIDNVPTEKGHRANGIEGYGFGKGLTHNYETFLKLLADLDGVVRRRKHVICVMHDCLADVNNPSGEDYKQFQPRLQMPSSGKSSIRHKVKEWLDHLFYIAYDIHVSEDGKAKGAGTRQIYAVERPVYWAKSRMLSDPIPYERGNSELWKQLLNKE
jgi:hypothetical protein